MRYLKVLAAASALALAALVVTPLQGQEAKPKAVSHSVEGRDNCMMCHSGAMQGVPGVPASHEGRANETCMLCHGPNSPLLTKEPPVIGHSLEGRANCRMCHSGAMPNVPAPPASHEGWDVKHCLLCHKTGG